MIIGSDLMVQLGLTTDFKHQVLQWDGETVPMKEPSGLLGKSDLNKHEMREVVMKTVEPASTIEGTVIYLRDRGATNSTIKRRHNKYHERKMRSNKV